MTVPAEGPRRDRKREADRRSYRRRKARAAGKTPEPAVRPVAAPRIRSSREQLPQTPGAPCQADPSLWFPEAPTLAGRRAEAEQASRRESARSWDEISAELDREPEAELPW